MIYVVGLVVFLAAAALFVEFFGWLHNEQADQREWEAVQQTLWTHQNQRIDRIIMRPRDEAKVQAEQDAWNAAYLSLVAPKPYDRKGKDA